jgi:mRNA interferase MazF
VELSTTECDITKDSVVLLEQIRTIDKQRLKERVCHLDTNTLKRVNYALKISLELIT